MHCLHMLLLENIGVYMSVYDGIKADIGSVDIEWWNRRSQPQIGNC